MPQTNKKCVQASEGDRGQRVSVEERTQGAPQSSTNGVRQGKGEGNKGTRPDMVTKKNAQHENNEKARKKEIRVCVYVCSRPKT